MALGAGGTATAAGTDSGTGIAVAAQGQTSGALATGGTTAVSAPSAAVKSQTVISAPKNPFRK
jgi:hypothetical protein